MDDNGDNRFEATLLASKETFEPHEFCFGGHKQRDKWCYEADDIHLEDFQEISKEQCEEENFGCDVTQVWIWEYFKRK